MTQVHSGCVLLVEDDPADIALTREAFVCCESAWSLHVARDAEACRGLFAGWHRDPDAVLPSLILLDLNLPGASGKELLDEFKLDPRTSDTPVVILTTSASPQDASECYRRKADGYLIKPIDLHDFVDMVLTIEKVWLEPARSGSAEPVV